MQSLSCKQPTHEPSVVSQMRASDAVQSVICTHCTQYMRVVSHTAAGARQSAFEPQPETQRFVFVLQVSPEPHWLVVRHSTQLPSLVQCVAPPEHCASVRQCTHCSVMLQYCALPQFASPTHSTQNPALVSQ